MTKEQMKEIMREVMQDAEDKIYDDVIADMENCFEKLKKSEINIPLIKEVGDISFEDTVDKIIEKWADYNENTEEKGVAECIVAKNRHGETGTVKLQWVGQYQSFADREWKHAE